MRFSDISPTPAFVFSLGLLIVLFGSTCPILAEVVQGSGVAASIAIEQDSCMRGLWEEISSGEYDIEVRAHDDLRVTLRCEAGRTADEVDGTYTVETLNFMGDLESQGHGQLERQVLSTSVTHTPLSLAGGQIIYRLVCRNITTGESAYDERWLTLAYDELSLSADYADGEFISEDGEIYIIAPPGEVSLDVTVGGNFFSCHADAIRIFVNGSLAATPLVPPDAGPGLWNTYSVTLPGAGEHIIEVDTGPFIGSVKAELKVVVENEDLNTEDAEDNDAAAPEESPAPSTIDDPDADSDGDGLSDGEEADLGTDPFDWDSDNDDLSDLDEDILGTDPLDADFDDDGITDGGEWWVTETNPVYADTDEDGWTDGEELQHGTDPLNPHIHPGDVDGDGLDNIAEVTQYFTDPNNPDSDFDCIEDAVEISTSGTNPATWDTDGDGLSDGDEVGCLPHDWGAFAVLTNPNLLDTDGDGIDDGTEVANGTDPLDPQDEWSDPDIDGDGLTNDVELSLGTYMDDADTDGDGLTDYEEVEDYGTDPTSPDTDGDALRDGDEVDIYGTNPTTSDSDDDDLPDNEEIFRVGTDPTVADTDGDGWSDGEETAANSDPLDPFDTPPLT